MPGENEIEEMRGIEMRGRREREREMRGGRESAFDPSISFKLWTFSSALFINPPLLKPTSKHLKGHSIFAKALNPLYTEVRRPPIASKH